MKQDYTEDVSANCVNFSSVAPSCPTSNRAANREHLAADLR
jgi:hypothetical protein